MRPNSIVWFERVVIASLVLGLVSTFALWGDTAAAVEATGTSSNAILGVTIVFFLAYAVILWFITRQRSKVAAWIYVALSVLSILTQLVGFPALLMLEPLMMMLSLVQLALAIASLVLLAKKESRDWLSGKDDTPYNQVFD